MAEWVDLYSRVRGWKAESYASRSCVNSLLRIFEAAERWGFVPDELQAASNSNLREIIRACKEAIERNDTQKLKEIFRQASALTNTELRIWLRGEEWEEFVARKVSIPGQDLYLLELTLEQLEKVTRAGVRSYRIAIE